MKASILFFFLVGGFVVSSAVGISYLASEKFEPVHRRLLGLTALLPLTSLVQLLGGSPGSWNKEMIVFPCALAGGLFLYLLSFRGFYLFAQEPVRGLVGLLAIGWAGAVSFAVSHGGAFGAYE